MPIQLPAVLVPTNNNTFALLEDLYVKGGLRVVANFSGLSSLHASTLKTGTLALTIDTSLLYVLGATGVWTSIDFASQENARAIAAEALLVPKTTTVNGHALGSNVTVAGTDITLSGYLSSAGTLTPLDTVVSAVSKLNGNTAALAATVTGSLTYQGVWDASANNPTIVPGSGTKGYYYKVSVAATRTIDSNSSWLVGDMIVFNGSTWDKIAGYSTQVVSVAGRVGAIVLNQADVSGLTPSSSPTFLAVTATTFTGALAGNAATVTNGVYTSTVGAAVLSAPLTGYASTTGTITATDTVLTSIEKLSGNLALDLSTGATKMNGVSLSSLGTGLLKNTTGTGVPSIAVAGTDYVAPSGALGTPLSGVLTNCTGYSYTNLAGTAPTWNQNTTGSAAKLTTARAISLTGSVTGTTNFDGSAAAAIATTSPYDIVVQAIGTIAASQVVLHLGVVRAFTIPANLAGSLCTVEVAPAAAAAFVLSKNGTAICTISIAAGAKTSSFGSMAQTSFAVGDVLTLVAPATADAAMSSVYFSIMATS